MVDWCYAGGTRFTQPFFGDTVREILQRPFSSLFPKVTPLEILPDVARNETAIPPTGFIFHMSRCGSTLISQMLAAVERNLVISEAAPIDEVLGLSRMKDHETRSSQLTWIVNALGRRRGPAEQNYFVKFDSWNSLELDLITKTFPDVPWVFVYREPVEVIVSQMRQRGSQMVPGAMATLAPDLSLKNALKTTPEEYCARLLARICDSALQHARDRNCLLVNYRELPDAIVTSVTRHFGVTFDATENEAMRTAAGFDAKNPRLYFYPRPAQCSARHA
jgi:hypothetical protein